MKSIKLITVIGNDLSDLVCDVRDEIVDYLQFHDIFPEKEDQD